MARCPFHQTPTLAPLLGLTDAQDDTFRQAAD